MISFNKKTASSFMTGFTSGFSALPFMLTNRMAKYLVAPLVINMVLIISGAWYAFVKIYPVLTGLFTFDQWYMQMFRYMMAPLLVILIMIVAFFAYSITGTLIASPFLDFISIRTEKVIGGNVPDPGFSLKALLRMASGMIKLLLLMVMLYLLILPVNLVPFAGSFLYLIISFVLTSFFCGYQFYELPLDRREYAFSEKLSICLKYWSTVIGTGAAFILISFIPVAGFLGVAVSACGATIAFRKVIAPSIARTE